MSGYVPVCSAAKHSLNGNAVNVKRPSDTVNRFATRTPFSDCANLIIGKPRGAYTLFVKHILGVLFRCTKKQMAWPDAWRIVTGVADELSFGNCSVVQLIRITMGTDTPKDILHRLEYSVPLVSSRTSPQPAVFGLKNLLPKLFFNRSKLPNILAVARTETSVALFGNYTSNGKVLTAQFARPVNSVPAVQAEAGKRAKPLRSSSLKGGCAAELLAADFTSDDDSSGSSSTANSRTFRRTIAATTSNGFVGVVMKLFRTNDARSGKMVTHQFLTRIGVMAPDARNVAGLTLALNYTTLGVSSWPQ